MIIEQDTSTKCFLCGTKNEKSLKLKWFTDTETKTVFSDILISDEYCGYSGIVHGGIVASLMDETAGRTTVLDNLQGGKKIFVTKKLEVEYIRPTPTNTPLRATGHIKSVNGRHY